MMNAATVYQGAKVNTATPVDLTLMLYEGAIKFCNIAVMGIEQNDIEKVNNNLIKAQRIIEELRLTLDFRYTVAGEFELIYNHIYAKLVNANIKKSKEDLEEALGQIRSMRDLWKEIMKLGNNPKF